MLALALLACTEPDPVKGTAPSTDTETSTETTPPVTDTATTATADTATDTGPPCGTLVSARSFGGAGYGFAPHLAVGADGSLRMAAVASVPLTLDEGGPNETTVTPTGVSDAWVAAEDSTGQLQWVRTVGGEGVRVQVTRVAAGIDGGAVVGGYADGPFTVARGEADAVDHAHLGGHDGWIARFGPAGELLWSRAIAGAGDDYGGAASVFADGSVVLTAIHRGALTLGPGEPWEAQVALPTGLEQGAVVVRLGPDGTLDWAQPIQGTTVASVYPAVIDPVTEDVLVSGWLAGTGAAVFGPGQPGEIRVDPTDMAQFVVRYASDGTVLQYTATHFPNLALSLDGNGDILLSGDVREPVVLDPGGPNQTMLAPTGDLSLSDAAVATFDPGGTLRWATQARASQFSYARSVAGAADGGGVLVGTFAGEVRFGTPPAAVDLQSSPPVVIGNSTFFFEEGYAARYDASGALRCAVHFPSASMSDVQHVVQRPDGTWAVSGAFGGRITLGAGTPEEIELVADSDADIDAFTAIYRF